MEQRARAWGAQGTSAGVSNFFGTRDWFCVRQCFHGPWRGVGDGLGMIQMYYIYRALYFYYYYISSTSDHQALDPEVGVPWPKGWTRGDGKATGSQCMPDG